MSAPVVGRAGIGAARLAAAAVLAALVAPAALAVSAAIGAAAAAPGVAAAASSGAAAADAPGADGVPVAAFAAHRCGGCHGAHGDGDDPRYPKLAGQVAPYLVRQLRDFKAQNGRRPSGVMGAMAVDLSTGQMQALAAFFARQPAMSTPVPAVSVDRTRLADGASIYRDGIAGRGVPACASCHGTDGAGLPTQFPRLAGQHAAYLAAQLQAFRAGRRTTDPDEDMAEVARRMDDRQIDAVARYIARMR